MLHRRVADDPHQIGLPPGAGFPQMRVRYGRARPSVMEGHDLPYVSRVFSRAVSRAREGRKSNRRPTIVPVVSAAVRFRLA